MVGPTHGADGFGFGRGGGTYRRRLERDLGMRADPFHRDIHKHGVVHRTVRAGGRVVQRVAISDRSVAGRLRATGHRRAWLGVLLAIALLVAGCGGGSGGEGARPGPTTTAGVPRLGSAPLLKRTPRQFQADLAALKGRVVVVNFWAEWCGPCRAEMPALQQVSKEYAAKPVTIIGVDSSDVRSSASKLLSDLKVTYPTVYDKVGINGGIATSWSVASLPQTWFVARDGSRSGRIPRPLSVAELRSRIDQLLTTS
jgi:thiol-disulfide isomerase/thioredoxin